MAAQCIPLYIDPPPRSATSEFVECVSFVCQSGDVARKGSFVSVNEVGQVDNEVQDTFHLPILHD